MIAQNKSRTLGLRIPACEVGVKPAFLASAEEMAAWIAALPLANIGETGRRVYTALLDFNRLELPAAERLKIAERLRQPLHYVLSNLEKHYLDIGLPLSPKGRKISALVQELHAEMAIPYKIGIEQSVAGRRPLGREALVLAVHRAIQHLSQVLLQSALLYLPTPPHIWQELHRLYAFAVQNQLETQPVTEPEAGRALDIATLYKRILLFTLANPYSLRQRENLYLFQQLPGWAQHARLHPPREGTDETQDFVVLLPSDEPPSHVRLQNQQPDGNSLLLETRELVAYLSGRALELPPTQKNLKPDQDGHVLSQGFLKRLIQAWGSTPSRAAVRTRQSFELKVAVGLTGLYALLRQEREEHHKKLSRREREDIDWLQHQIALDQAFGGANHGIHVQPAQELVFSLNPGQPGGEGRTGYSPAIIGTTLHADNPAPWADERSRQAHATLTRQTLNESTGGYCLSWSGTDTSKIRVGELLGIQSANDPQQYGIGAIRWMKETPEQELQIGVQVLAPQCQPVKIYLPNDVQHKEARPCLMVPAGEAGGELISPTFLYEIGETLRLEDEDGDHLIRLNALRESTGTFARFDFYYVTTPETATREGTADAADDDTQLRRGYDNVWDTL